MTLSEFQKSYHKAASILGDYTKISKLDLGNGYCDAEEAGDESLRSAYWSALMLRYFPWINKWISNSYSCKLQKEDYHDWLSHALWVAFYYRDWRWPYKAVVKNGKFIKWKLDENGNKIPNEHYYKVDPNSFDRTVNYFCAAQRGLVYQNLNKDKRRATVLNSSLDEAIENVGDSALEESGATYEDENNLVMKGIIHALLDKGRLIESLIVDGIANHDAFKLVKHEREISEVYAEEIELDFKPERYTYEHVFDKRRLMRHLNSIDENFMLSYFAEAYDLTEEECEEIFLKLKTTKNDKLYRYIDKTLINLRSEPELLSHLVA